MVSWWWGLKTRETGYIAGLGFDWRSDPLIYLKPRSVDYMQRSYVMKWHNPDDGGALMLFGRSALALLLGLLPILTSCGRDDGGVVPPPGSGNAGNCVTGCQRGYRCSAATCSLDPAGLWKITVTSGRIATTDPTGSSWDTFGGAPDPLVCLTIAGQRSCTAAIQDSFTPLWNEEFPLATATALLSGVTVEIIDSDIASNDDICRPTLTAISEATFLAGSLEVGCSVASIKATLRPQ